MVNTKHTILQKHINGELYTLLVKTNSALVEMTSGASLESVIASITADLTTAKSNIATLIGDDGAESIAGQIQTAINALTNEEDETSLAGKIATINSTIIEITDTSTGILAKSKEYTDQVIGLDGTAYETVKAYVDGIKADINSSIGGALHFKGNVRYPSNLPTDASTGDVYQVWLKEGAHVDEESNVDPADVINAEYAFNGTEWVELGTVVDLSAYYTSEQVQATITLEIGKVKDRIDGVLDESDATSLGGRVKILETSNVSLVEKVNAAQSAAENAATVAASKATIYVSEAQPENMQDGDLWLQIVDDTSST